jgi:cell division septation protein DedD
MPVETVLVIGTCGRSGEEIAAVLRSEGYEVLAAPDAVSAAGMSELRPPSLVLLHDEDGAETARFCGLSPDPAVFPPVIIVSSPERKPPSGSTPPFVRGFLELPFDPAELVEKTMAALIPPVMAPDGTCCPAAPAANEEGSGSNDSHEGAEKSESSSFTSTDFKPGKIFELRKEMRRRKRKRKMMMAVSLLVACVVAAVFLSYRALREDTKVSYSRTAAASPSGTGTDSPPTGQKTDKAAANQGLSLPAATGKEVKEDSPAAAAKPPSSPVWSVQVGAFRNSASAEKVAGEYKEKGYDAFTEKGTTKKSDTVYRVLVGRFGNQQESWRFGRTVSDKEGIPVTIFNIGR